MSRKKKIFRWPSTKKEQNGKLSMHSKPSDLGTPSAKWYQSLDLPLSRYIDCVVDGNYSALIISGTPSDQDILLAWADICDQYSDIVGDAEHRMYLKLYKEIAKLSITLQQIQILVEVLVMVNNKPFEDKLNKLLRTNFKFEGNNRGPELEKCLRQAKRFKLTLDMKLSHFEAVKIKNENAGQKITREYFSSILITLSDHVKYQITDSIKTFEFCERVRRYSQFVEHQKQANDRRQNK